MASFFGQLGDPGGLFGLGLFGPSFGTTLGDILLDGEILAEAEPIPITAGGSGPAWMLLVHKHRAHGNRYVA